jgi:mannan endo-1,4-beta-mannosidase
MFVMLDLKGMVIIMRKRITSILIITAMIISSLTLAATAQTVNPDSTIPAVRYEAEAAQRSGDATVRSSGLASGGQYVEMRDGSLTFTVNVPITGFYTVTARYSNHYGPKDQNLFINGTAVGASHFPETGTALTFRDITILQKVRLNAGNNTIAITRNWGWIDMDYIEVGEFIPTPFNLDYSLVTPNPSRSANRMYNFLLESFGKRIISGVMTNAVTNGNNPLTNIEAQQEVAHIRNASGKTPALIGFDFMHGTGRRSEEAWFIAYNTGMLNLAEDLYSKGGIPTFAWHWKDPSLNVESGGFYTDNTSFDVRTVFTPGSAGYNAMIRDIDIASGYLKRLADKDIPVLWRPLHEAAGRWFWWGAHGPNPNKALWHLMFDRMTNHHGLDNLIWVWTCEEGSDALDWYPGDQYVDIIARDFYYYPVQKNHGSLMASFENLKEIYGGRKMVTLGENGSIPYPENLIEDNAGWSWFMPWYGEWTGINNNNTHNSTADWSRVMNHDYVITLEDMPGWRNLYISNANAAGDTRIELHNNAVGTISARGLYLSNDDDDNFLWQLPSIILRRGGAVQINSGIKRMNTNFTANIRDRLCLTDAGDNFMSSFRVAR